MRIDLPFEDENGKPLPGGIACLINNKKKGNTFITIGYPSDGRTTRITENTNFRMASLSKQYTAAAVLLSESKKRLKLSDLIGKYFRNVPKCLVHITIQQLLNHTSGITDYEQLIPKNKNTQLKDKDVLALIKEKGSLYFAPGTQFRYSNTGYCLLAQIIESVHQMPFSLFMQQYIFQRHRLSATIYEKNKVIPNRAYGFKITHDKAFPADQNLTSATQGDGGVYTSLNAYGQWIKKLFSGQLIAGYTARLFGDNKVPVKDGVFYNLGWFFSYEKDGTACAFHSGESTGFRNIVYYNPEKDFLRVLFSNTEGKEVALSALFETLCADIQLSQPVSLPLMQWMSNIYSFWPTSTKADSSGY